LRVGNGFSINIWKDRWLPTPVTHKVQSPQRLVGQLDVVGELIDHNRGAWKEDIIRENFLQEEADVILNIPLSPRLPPDRLIWKESKDGKFSVRNAYHLGLCINDLSKGQCSRGLEEKLIWKFLWSLKVPNQVKTFSWHACHDILPTKSNLLKRKVIEEDICPCCNLENETLFHALCFAQRPRMYGGIPNLVFRSATCFVILLNPFLRNVWLDSPKKIWNSLLLLLVRSG
jgi:hypothetical protein